MLKPLGSFLAFMLIIGCGGRSAAPPDAVGPAAPVTPRFAQVDPAIGYLAEAFRQQLVANGGEAAKPPAAPSTPEGDTRRNAQDAMDELDREIAGMTAGAADPQRVRSTEVYPPADARHRSPSDASLVIAIADFVTEAGKVTKLGRYIADKLSLFMTPSRRFKVVERALMDQVLAEQQFQVSAFVDPEATIEFGRLVGAETIISGTVSNLGDVYYLNAKAIDVARGHLRAVIDVEVTSSGRLAALYRTELPHLNRPKQKTKVFRAQGIGIPSPHHQNPTLARAMALRAAKGDAMRNLVQQIQGVQLDADTTIKDMMTQDDTIRIQLNTTLQGARMVHQSENPDGSVEVEMEVELTEPLMERLYAD